MKFPGLPACIVSDQIWRGTRSSGKIQECPIVYLAVRTFGRLQFIGSTYVSYNALITVAADITAKLGATLPQIVWPSFEYQQSMITALQGTHKNHAK